MESLIQHQSSQSPYIMVDQEEDSSFTVVNGRNPWNHVSVTGMHLFNRVSLHRHNIMLVRRLL